MEAAVALHFCGNLEVQGIRFEPVPCLLEHFARAACFDSIDAIGTCFGTLTDS